MKGLEIQTRVSYPSPLPSCLFTPPRVLRGPHLSCRFQYLLLLTTYFFHFVLFCFTTNKKKDCNLPLPPPTIPRQQEMLFGADACTELIKSMRIIGRTTGPNLFFSPPIYPVRITVNCSFF